MAATMNSTAATYKATKPEIYSAIADILDDPAADAPSLQEAVAAENPNWQPIPGRKFKKYYKRVVAAKEAGIDPKDAGNLVSDDASVSTIGSIKKKLGSIKKSMKSSTPSVPGSIGGPLFSPSPLKEEPIREEGVEYSAVPPPILSDGTADITPDHSDRELDLSTSAYVDDNDGTTKDKKDECCAQGCIIL